MYVIFSGWSVTVMVSTSAAPQVDTLFSSFPWDAHTAHKSDILYGNLGERHSRVTWDHGTVRLRLCILSASTVLSRDRPFITDVAFARDGPGVPIPLLKSTLHLLGLGFCASLAQIFFVFFFLASIFQTNRMFKPVFCADFWCADFCAHFCAHFWCADFCAHFCADFWCADFCAQFCAHFCAHFPQIFLRRFGAWKIGVPESRKNAQKMRGKMRGIRMALLGGEPHSLSACSSRQYATQPPLGRHTQGEHVSVHRDIFGLNYMLAFAPRFFKNKNPRKMSSAKPQPQHLTRVWNPAPSATPPYKIPDKTSAKYFHVYLQ